MQNRSHKRREQFARDGFYIFENILDSPILDRLRRCTDDVLARQDPAHFEQHRTTGSMVMIDWAMAYQHPVMAELIAHPNVLAALQQLGFDDPKFGHGRIISKPAHSPPLFWHEDGRFWDDPVSYTTQPIQCFLMYYLTDTTPQNGCLRVIPGSHLKRHALHDKISPSHTDDLRTFANPDDPGFSRVADEIDVPSESWRSRHGVRQPVARFPCQPDRSAPDRAHDVVLSRLRCPTRAHAGYSCASRSQHRRRGLIVCRDPSSNGTAQNRVRWRGRADSDTVDTRRGVEVRNR